MSRVKLSFLSLALLASLGVTAQISESEYVIRSSTNKYKHYSSLVRNYDKGHNVVMQYGYFTNVVSITGDSIKGYSSFLIQDINTGDVMHIVDLPWGYQVNDVRFVTLKKKYSLEPVDFCCFCGTRTQLDNVTVLPAMPDEPTTYVFHYSKHGFAGFFSMEEALAPTSAFKARVRDVENAVELYRMTCYAESWGYHNDGRATFEDNAVLDIIGTDDTTNGPSCFYRAKFYPVYGTGVLWDNNIRANDNEVLTDITKTDNYVVTVSNDVAGDSLWVRYSGMEDHLVFGGLQLDTVVDQIHLTNLQVQPGCNSGTVFKEVQQISPAKICHTEGDGIEVACGVSEAGKAVGDEWLFNGQYNYNSGGLNLWRASLLDRNPRIKEMLYMPIHDVTAILHEHRLLDYISMIRWDSIAHCLYDVSQYSAHDLIFHSMALGERNGFNHLYWTAIDRGDPLSPMRINSQSGSQIGVEDPTCHWPESVEARTVIVENSQYGKAMKIKYRYPYDEVRYPVKDCYFDPYIVNTWFRCKKQ